jgi:hypothetical protein
MVTPHRYDVSTRMQACAVFASISKSGALQQLNAYTLVADVWLCRDTPNTVMQCGQSDHEPAVNRQERKAEYQAPLLG